MFSTILELSTKGKKEAKKGKVTFIVTTQPDLK